MENNSVTKKCTKCLEDKDLTFFGKKKNTKDGLNFVCKPCVSVASKKAYELNSDKKKASAKAYYEANKTEVLSKRDSEVQKEKSKKWREENREWDLTYKKEYRKNNKVEIQKYDKEYKSRNKEQIQAQRKVRLKEDPLFKLRINVAKRLGEAIRNSGNTKTRNFESALGCTYEFLKDHLSSQFTEGMTWDNYG